MAEQPASYYSELTVEGSLKALGTTRDGLYDAEADRRLQLDGPNKLPKIARRPWYLNLAQNFIHLFALLLLWGIGTELCLMMILIYFPPVAGIFNMSPLGVREWLLIVAFGVLLLLFEEGREFIARQTLGRRLHDVGPMATEVKV
jgi:magnesium-transporting ATPase (P-type)